MNYLAKIHAAETTKSTSLDKSHEVLKGVRQFVNRMEYLDKNDHHPEIQKAANHLKKVYDKHTQIVKDETAKLISNPKPSNYFSSKVKEILKLAKSTAGSGAQATEKTESIVEEVPLRNQTKTNVIFSRATIILSKGGKEYKFYLYEDWEPSKDLHYYDVKLGGSSNSLKGEFKNQAKTLTFDPQPLDDDLIRTGFKVVKGTKGSSLRVADKIEKKLKEILERLRLSGCDMGKISREGAFDYHRECHFRNYDYDLEDIDGDDQSSIESDVDSDNPNPKYYVLFPDFNSEKGYFDVEIGITELAKKMLQDDPDKLEKELGL